MPRMRRLFTALGWLTSVSACGDGDAAGSGASSAAGPTSGDAATGPGATTATAGQGGAGGISVDPPTCVDPATLPAWRAGLAPYEYVELTSADLTVVTPAVMPGGGYYGRIDAWNGIAADVVTSRLYLGAAGGHADYAGNEVYMLDLTAAAPQWVLLNQPSPASAYTIDQPYYADGLPSPTHTYYTLWYVEQHDKLFRFAGGATWGSGNGTTPHIDAFDPDSLTWDPAGTHPDLGPSPTYEMPTAKDVLSGQVYQLQGDNHLYRWNPTGDTVEDLGNASAGSDSFYDLYASASVVDVASQRVLFFSDLASPGAARVFDIGTGAWSAAPIGGGGAAAVTEESNQAMAFFDVCSGTILYKTRAGGDVYEIDPATLVAELRPTTGATPPDPLNGVHTLFQYVPRLGGYAYQPTHDAKLYFLATQ